MVLRRLPRPRQRPLKALYNVFASDFAISCNGALKAFARPYRDHLSLSGLVRLHKTTLSDLRPPLRAHHLGFIKGLKGLNEGQ